MPKPGDCEAANARRLEGAEGRSDSPMARLTGRPFLENLVGLLGELQGLEMPLTLGLELSLARLEILRVLRLSQNQNRD